MLVFNFFYLPTKILIFDVTFLFGKDFHTPKPDHMKMHDVVRKH